MCVYVFATIVCIYRREEGERRRERRREERDMLYCIHLMSTKERYNYKKGIYLFLTLDSGVIGVVGALSHSSFSLFLSPSPSPSFSPSNPLPDFSSRVKGSVTDVFRIVSSVSSMVVSCTVLAATEVVTELRD